MHTPSATRYLSLAAGLAADLATLAGSLPVAAPVFAGRTVRHANTAAAVDVVEDAARAADQLVKALYLALHAEYGGSDLAEHTGTSRQAVSDWSRRYATELRDNGLMDR